MHPHRAGLAQVGCLSELAGAQAIVKAGMDAALSGRSDTLARRHGAGEPITAAEVAAAAAIGDRANARTWATWSDAPSRP